MLLYVFVGEVVWYCVVVVECGIELVVLCFVVFGDFDLVECCVLCVFCCFVCCGKVLVWYFVC